MRKWILPVSIAVLLICGVAAVALHSDVMNLIAAWQQKREESDSSVSAASGGSSEILLDPAELASGGLDIATRFTGPIRDTNSLAELRTALESRGRRGLDALNAQLREIQQSPDKEPRAELNLYYQIGTLSIYEGQFDKAIEAYENALKHAPEYLADTQRRTLKVALGIIALRRGEIDNCIECVGPSSCIFPIAASAIHQHPAGSREAIRHFTEYLEELPGDLRVRWLLNLAFMTLGEYPNKVPPQYLIPLDGF